MGVAGGQLVFMGKSDAVMRSRPPIWQREKEREVERDNNQTVVILHQTVRVKRKRKKKN